MAPFLGNISLIIIPSYQTVFISFYEVLTEFLFFFYIYSSFLVVCWLRDLLVQGKQKYIYSVFRVWNWFHFSSPRFPCLLPPRFPTPAIIRG